MEQDIGSKGGGSGSNEVHGQAREGGERQRHSEGDGSVVGAQEGSGVVSSRTRSKKRLWAERVEVQNEEEIKRQRGDSGGGGGDVDVEQNGGVKVVKSRKRRGEIAHGRATECSKRQRGQVAEVGGIRRSKRLAERAGDGTEHDTEHVCMYV